MSSKHLSPEQRERYSRNINLPEVGEEGQKKLLQASVLVVGGGGLGSPVALYLAAAGVGRIGLVDFDLLELSNLQRQVIYRMSDLRQPKAQAAAQAMAAINPEVKVVPYQIRLSPENIEGTIAGYDLVVDCPDNFPTRYLVNDACVVARKPLVEGSIFRFEGQVTVFLPGRGCYRCLYPVPPPPDLVSASPLGPLGVVPGIIGVIQATEAMKLILGIGEPLVGRLVLYDALAMEFREVKLRRHPACPTCGDKPSIVGPAKRPPTPRGQTEPHSSA